MLRVIFTIKIVARYRLVSLVEKDNATNTGVNRKAICSHMFCERYLSDYFSREKRSPSSPCYQFFIIFNRLCKRTLCYDKALWFYVFILSSIFLVLGEQGTRRVFSQRINPVLLLLAAKFYLTRKNYADSCSMLFWRLRTHHLTNLHAAAG